MNKRRNSKPAKKKVDAKDLRSRTNDVSWYSMDSSLLRDSASIPFSWPIGTHHNLNTPNFDKTTVIPGVCTIKTIPSCGYVSQANDALNVSAYSLYSFVRHQNSGSSNYDAPDLMLYMLSMTQVYSCITWLQRIYGIASLYSHRNRYLPRVLLEANGVNPDDIINNLAAFRYGINVLINKAASLAVPAIMPIFKRHAFMYQNIYSEGPSVKDQLYMYVPGGFWKYQLNEDGSGMLKLSTMEHVCEIDRASASELLELCNNLLAPIIASEDMNIMSGDIIKAYGANALIKLAPLDTNYPIVPIFDPVVLEQMKNATCVGAITTLSNVVQESSRHAFLLSTPTISLGTGGGETVYRENYDSILLLETKILSTAVPEASPEIVIENTRLTVAAERNNNKIHFLCGSEIPLNFFIWTIDENGESQNFVYQYGMSMPYNEPLRSRIRDFALLGHFKYHPAVRIAATSYADDTFTVHSVDHIWNIDNYALLPTNDLKRLHDAALMSELAVPSLNKFTK